MTEVALFYAGKLFLAWAAGWGCGSLLKILKQFMETISS